VLALSINTYSVLNPETVSLLIWRISFATNPLVLSTLQVVSVLEIVYGSALPNPVVEPLTIAELAIHN